MTPRTIVPFRLFAFLLTLLLAAPSFANDSATIVRVVDGDTVEIMLKGQKEKVGVAALFWKKLRSVRYPFGAAAPIPFL
jgi:endonuclease YncB( thermonuclease family)